MNISTSNRSLHSLRLRKALALIILSALGLGLPIVGLSVLAHAQDDGTFELAQLQEEGEDAAQVRPGVLTAFVHRASKLVGASVVDAKGEELGEVEDLVLRPRSGAVELVLVSTGGVLEDDELRAVPFRLLAPEHRTEGESRFRFTRDASELKAAPVLDEDALERFHDGAWSARVHEHFGTEPGPEELELDEDAEDGGIVEEGRRRKGSDEDGEGAQDDERKHGAQARIQFVRTSELVDEIDVEGQTGDELGELEDLAIDPVNARVVYMVVESGGVLGIGGEEYALPWALARLYRKNGEEDELALSVPVTEDKLDKAPEFDGSEWERMSDPTWIRSVYEYYGVKPYWSEAVEAGFHREGTRDAEDGDRKRDRDEDHDDGERGSKKKEEGR